MPLARCVPFAVLSSVSLATLRALPAQDEPGDEPKHPPMWVAPASGDAQQAIRGFQLANGLVCELVAAEPDLANPVAFAIDGKGRFFVAETFRIKQGVFDTRDHMKWRDEDLACTTVADRVAKYRRYFADGGARFAALTERVRLLVDTDRDGRVDASTVFADGFAELADGIASGVLPVGGDVWFTNIPKLWRLRDTNGDGVADERTAIHDGYGVHTSLIGHDLHGLVLGPDRRLYFSIGDRGFHVQQGDRTLAFPHEGAVLRCELDGSDLEVVHRGLRNPQELAFDAHGDLFTGDNNSDGGDQARLVQIVPGADSGWRIGYQWLPDRGAWNREDMWRPRHPGQAAGILPPIANVADGPSGLVFDPGVGLSERFRGCFFLCDFRGGPANSGVLALRLQRAGAGYELASTDRVVRNVLATDVDFGPDGALYLLDWVDSWTKTGKGRIYRLRTPGMANDVTLRATAQLLASDLTARTPAALQPLLAHPDRRVRQQAQFALVDLDAADVLLAAANAPEPRLARLHGVLGLGVLGRRDAERVAPLLPLLDDGDGDVRALAARVLGDARLPAALAKLQRRLTDDSARVRREAALALARFGEQPGVPATGEAAAAAVAKATQPLLALLRGNDDHDPVLRHAAAFALAAVAPAAALHAALDDASRAVRLGALLALARRADPAIARLLQDPDSGVRAAAARAIYEQPIPAAMQALAQLCYDNDPDVLEAVDWRAINANRVLGLSENGEALVHLAAQPNHPARTRVEALEVLGEWLAPSKQCRVTGNWRPCEHPGAPTVAACFLGSLHVFVADAATAAAAATAAGRLRLQGASPHLVTLLRDNGMPAEARRAALDALATLGAPELDAELAAIGSDAPVPLRNRAVALLAKTAPAKAVPVLATLLANAPQSERQAAFEALGDLRDDAAAALLREWLARLQREDVPLPLRLDLLEAAAKHESLRGELDALARADAAKGPLGPFLAAREGGDARAGRKLFREHEASRCTRCHALGGTGGNAGPALDGIGSRLSRDQLLEALVAPNARIAEGYAATTIAQHDGTTWVGIVTRDQDGAVTLMPGTGEPVTIPWTAIAKRTPNGSSAMPEMTAALTRRQLRDLVEFLTSLRSGG